GIWIVDAPIEALGVEAHGVGNTQHDHFAVLQGDETVVEIGGRNRNVFAEANGVVLVDPGVIARFDASIFKAFEAPAGILVELPPCRAVIAGRLRTVERPFAEAAVETGKMSARFRAPGNAIRVDVTAADADSRLRHGEELRQLRLGIETQEAGLTAEHADRVPDRAIYRIRHDRVRPRAACNARVLSSIGRLARVGVLIALAVAVSVEDERRPAGRLLRVVRFIPHFRVDPAGDRTGAGQPQRVVGVVTELRMMCTETGVDE